MSWIQKVLIGCSLLGLSFVLRPRPACVIAEEIMEECPNWDQTPEEVEHLRILDKEGSYISKKSSTETNLTLNPPHIVPGIGT